MIEDKLYEGDIPFDDDGNLLTYPRFARGVKSGPNWIPNHIFFATMAVDGITRGQSAARFIWVDQEGQRYDMFMTDMVNLLKTNDVRHGVRFGNWTFCKRGANYGLRATNLRPT